MQGAQHSGLRVYTERKVVLNKHVTFGVLITKLPIV